MTYFVDTNIFLYAVGDDAEWKDKSQVILQGAREHGGELVTSVEVLQELLHYAVRKGKRQVATQVVSAAISVVDRVLPVYQRDVERAIELVGRHPTISARDALHLAVVFHEKIVHVLTFDRHFENIPGITVGL